VTESGANKANEYLPEMNRLARVSFLACLPIIAIGLMLKAPRFCVGVLGGYFVCVLLYAFLRAFVTIGMDAVVADVRGQANIKVDGFAKAKFLVVSLGKFLVIGAAMVVLLGLFKVQILGFVVGFLIAQLATSLYTYRQLKNTPRL
jgi:hypothetical protein